MRCEEADIPARMKRLPRDKRGLPVPYVVWNDSDGNPHFTINDVEKVAHVLANRHCALCGQPITNGYWMVGGPLSSFLPNGAYNDAPVHKDCGHFALKVCPFMVMQKYTKRIDAKTVRNGDEAHLLLEDPTMIATQPAVFVFGKTSRYGVHGRMLQSWAVIPKRPWLEVEFWRHGEQLAPADAFQLIAADQTNHPHMEAMLPLLKKAL